MYKEKVVLNSYMRRLSFGQALALRSLMRFLIKLDIRKHGIAFVTLTESQYTAPGSDTLFKVEMWGYKDEK